MRRLQLGHLVGGDLIVADDTNVEPCVQLAQALDQVPGERIVIVDQQDYDFPTSQLCRVGWGWALLAVASNWALAWVASNRVKQSAEAAMSYQPPSWKSTRAWELWLTVTTRP